MKSKEPQQSQPASAIVHPMPAGKVILYSFGAMAIWPLLGLILSYRWFDHPSEAVLLLGGVTIIFMIPIQLLIELSNQTYSISIVLLWLMVWLIPLTRMLKAPKNLSTQRSILFKLTLFSLGQSVLGFLMILGKGV